MQDPVGGVALRRRALGIGSLDGIWWRWKKTSAGLRRGKVEEELAALQARGEEGGTGVRA